MKAKHANHTPDKIILILAFLFLASGIASVLYLAGSGTISYERINDTLAAGYKNMSMNDLNNLFVEKGRATMTSSAPAPTIIKISGNPENCYINMTDFNGSLYLDGSAVNWSATSLADGGLYILKITNKTDGKGFNVYATPLNSVSSVINLNLDCVEANSQWQCPFTTPNFIGAFQSGDVCAASGAIRFMDLPGGYMANCIAQAGLDTSLLPNTWYQIYSARDLTGPLTIQSLMTEPTQQCMSTAQDDIKYGTAVWATQSYATADGNTAYPCGSEATECHIGLFTCDHSDRNVYCNCTEPAPTGGSCQYTGNPGCSYLVVSGCSVANDAGYCECCPKDYVSAYKDENGIVTCCSKKRPYYNSSSDSCYG